MNQYLCFLDRFTGIRVFLSENNLFNIRTRGITRVQMEMNEKVIAQFFVEREGESILDVIRDIDFIEEGILDSLDIVSLSDFIEVNVGKTIDITNEEDFHRLRRFESLVELVSGQ